MDLDLKKNKNSDGILNIQTLGKKDKPPALIKGTDKKDKPEEKPKQKKDKKPLVLPIEVSAQIRLNGINLLYDDQGKKQKFSIRDFDINLSAPSVKTAPVKLSIGADVYINDQAIPRSTVNASVKNLFDTKGALNIDGIIAGLDANLPGILADVTADMKSSEIKSKIQVDLATVMEVAIPLIPKFPAPTEIKGNIVLTATSGTRPDAPLAFDATLSGSGLTVSGKVISGKSMGPGSFSVQLNGVVDLQEEKLDLKTAEMRILENSHIHAAALLEQFKQDVKEIHLAVSPLYLDLNEIIAFAGPLIPSTVEFDNQGEQAKISLNKLHFDGQLPTGKASVLLDQLEFNLPKIL
jgi:hypothetical protein